ncbi:MAG: helix-turn-helix domain-containing protein [archaeon]
MIVKEDFLNKLRQYFNLNLYEVKIWTALLSRGSSTAGELSEISDVPRSRAYDVLETLEKKGFTVMKLGKPITYIAVNPTEVIERAKKNVKTSAEDNVKKLESLRGTELLTELELLHKQGIEFIEAADLSGALRGRTNIHTHMEMMLKNAKKNITIMSGAKGLVRKIDTLKETLAKAHKRGVKIRIAAPVTKESATTMKSLQKIAELKNASNITARFCVVDDKEIIFMLMGDEDVHSDYDVGIWVNTPFFISALTNMFNLAWDNMEDADKVLKKL